MLTHTHTQLPAEGSSCTLSLPLVMIGHRFISDQSLCSPSGSFLNWLTDWSTDRRSLCFLQYFHSPRRLQSALHVLTHRSWTGCVDHESIHAGWLVLRRRTVFSVLLRINGRRRMTGYMEATQACVCDKLEQGRKQWKDLRKHTVSTYSVATRLKSSFPPHTATSTALCVKTT